MASADACQKLLGIPTRTGAECPLPAETGPPSATLEQQLTTERQSCLDQPMVRKELARQIAKAKPELHKMRGTARRPSTEPDRRAVRPSPAPNLQKPKAR